MATSLEWNVWLEAFSNLLENLGRLPPVHVEQIEGALVSEREHCVVALTAVATFISTFDKRHGHRFFDLAQKIGDLNKGQRAPLLEPAKIWDRRADPSHRWMARGRAVLAIEALTRTGTKPGIAAQRISHDNPRLHEFAGAKAKETPLHKTLLNWRKEFRARRVKDLDASILFDEGVKQIDKWLAAGRRDDVLAIAENVYEAAKIGGVLSPPMPTKN
jgi:hypothetical protein